MAQQKMDEYIQLMRARGFRATPQRQMILAEVMAGGGHHTLEEIYQRVHRLTPTLNRATIYRALDFFCELRILVAADIGGGHWVYELAGDEPHHHLICRTCGAVCQIPHSSVEEFYNFIKSEHAFSLDMDHMALFGLCQECKHKEETGMGESQTGYER